VRLRDRPSPAEPASAVLDPGLVFRVVGASSQYFRVLLPDGGTGYVSSGDVVPAPRPVSSLEER
jgi:hypothetical protein